jgi:two-component system, NarL family, sensor histidine kinase DesK
MAEEPASALRDPTRMSRRKWTTMSAAWSVLLLIPVVNVLGSDRPLAARVLLVAAVAVFAVGYVVGVFTVLERRSLPVAAGFVAVMTALWLATAVAGSGSLSVSFLLVVALAVLPPRAGRVVAVVLVVGALVVVTALGGFALDRFFGDLISMAAICLAQIGMFAVIHANAQLRDAREELAALAVTAERERMARDLHDVLGHSLTSITVKAGLARRLLERGDAERAAAEVGDVEQLGRQALADVRATVSANRVASLPRELAGAKEALRAAGITAEMPTAVDDVPPDRQQAFAYVVREGVTNVIRHSGASRVTVVLGPTSVEVVDDGVGSPATTPSGNGLRGLTERMAAIGGWVDAGPVATGGYRLRAEVAPARRTDPVTL